MQQQVLGNESLLRLILTKGVRGGRLGALSARAGRTVTCWPALSKTEPERDFTGFHHESFMAFQVSLGLTRSVLIAVLAPLQLNYTVNNM